MIIPIKGLTEPLPYSKYSVNASTYSGSYTVPGAMRTAGETDKPGKVPAHKALAIYHGGDHDKTGSLVIADLKSQLLATGKDLTRHLLFS